MRQIAIACALALSAVTTAYANNTELVKDIYQSTDSSSPKAFTTIGALTFFVADDGVHGRELWVTDGTPGSAHIVKDIDPVGGAKPNSLAVFDGKLFFQADDGTSGQELWKSDGTEGGTQLVADINPAGDSLPQGLVVFGSFLYFVANDGTTGRELWRSDGSAIGTTLVKDLNPAGDSDPRNLVSLGSDFFFSATDGTGRELYVSNGTPAGTSLMKDINPGAGSDPRNLTRSGSRVFFVADNGTNGPELWSTDGSVVGTALVKDINATTDPAINFLVDVAGTLYFSADNGVNGYELWKSNGTGVGTVMVADIIAGATGSEPNSLTNVGGTLFFVATTAAAGFELWKSDGTVPGTVLVKDISPGALYSANINNLTDHNGQLYFTADDGFDGAELWRSNGTAAGTVEVADINPGAGASHPLNLASSGVTLFMGADNGVSGWEPYAYNGVSTNLIGDLNQILAVGGDSNIEEPFKYQNAIYFSATDGLAGRELWVTDGSTAGTALLKDIQPGGNGSAPGYFAAASGKVLFAADDGTNGRELWVTDGTPGGTALLKDIRGGALGSFPAYLTSSGGKVFFIANDGASGFEPWVSDGTAGGTFRLKDIYAGVTSANPRELTDVNGTLFFRATDGTNGTELWKSDGTIANTLLVRDIWAGLSSSNPTSLCAFNGALYFNGTNGSNGNELWKSDGTLAGTVLLRDIRAGGATSSSSPSGLTALGTAGFVFAANNGGNGLEPWFSDGTAGGTILLADVNTAGNSNPNNFYVYQGKMYFSAISAANGNELWSTNGTVAGTALVRDINASGDSNPSDFARANGTLFFSAFEPGNGNEVWKSDGTTAGTVLAAEIRPGTYSSGPRYFASMNGIVYCVADDGVRGRELWLIYEDVTPPTVTSIALAGPSPTNGSSITFTVVFSEDVTGVDASDFTLTASGMTGASVTGVVQNAADNYTVTVATGTGEGTIRLNVIDNDSILDAAKNPLGGSGVGNGNYTIGPSYDIDNVPPAVLSIVRAGANPTNAATVDFTVTLTEDVTGLGLLDFVVTTGGSVSGASVVSRTKIAPGVHTVTVNTGSGDGTIRLDVIDNDSVIDALGNPLGGVGAGNGEFTSGEVYSVDKTIPSVLSITRLDANPNANATVDFAVTFSEDVVGVDVGDFVLTTSGFVSAPFVASRTVTSPSTVTVTVDTGTGNGTVRLDLADNDSVTDPATNPLGGAGAGNGSFTAGEAYTIDKTVPTVDAIVRADTSPTNAASVNYTVSFSVPVIGVDTSDFALTTTGSITGASVTSVSAGPSDVYTVTVNTGSNDGTIRLDLVDDDSINDGVFKVLGGPGAGNGSFSLGEEYAVDKTAPAVASITAEDTNPSNASTIRFLVTFTEDVSGVNVADFSLTTTGGLSGASIVSRTNLTPQTTRVTVSASSGAGTIQLDVNDDDSIVDTSGNKLGGTGNGNGNFTTGIVYTVDNTMPAVSSITLAGPTPTNASSVDFTVTFSEAVSGVDTADFVPAAVGVSGASVTGVVQNTPDNYTVTVGTGTGSGSIRLDVVDDDSIVDTFPNPLGGPGTGNGDYAAGPSYTIDRSAPSVASITRASANPSSAASVDFTVTFAESVSGVDVADFTLTTALLTGASIGGVTPVSGTVYTVSVNTGSGNGTIRLDVQDNDTIVDTAANPLGGAGAANGDFTTGDVYTIDKSVPTVLSIVRANADPTNAASVDFTVTFSENVSGVGIGDFTLTTSGVTGPAITGIAPGTNVYTVTVNTGSGSGTIRLDLVDDDSIVSGTFAPLGGVGAGNGSFASGESYTVDRVPPTISIGAPSPASTVNGPVDFVVTFTGTDVVTMTNADVILNVSGTVTGTVNVSGSGNAARTVTISGISGDGGLSISILGGVVSDLAGNSSSAAGPSTYVVVGTGPSLPVNPWLVAVAMAALGVLVLRRMRGERGRQSKRF